MNPITSADLEKYRFLSLVLDSIKWEPKGLKAITRELKLKLADTKRLDAFLSKGSCLPCISVAAPRDKGDKCSFYISWSIGSDFENVDAFLIKLFICDTSSKKYKIDAAITKMSEMVESYFNTLAMFADRDMKKRALTKIAKYMNRFKGKGLMIPISNWGVHFFHTSNLRGLYDCMFER